MFDRELTQQAEALLQRARTAGVMIVTAESCTGGLVSALLTEIPGSSDVVDRAFVTYSNEAKTEMLGIPARVIAANGAVSREVALRMAENALLKSNADIAVSITGIAGPGGSEHKPAGLVHFGLAVRDRPGMCEVHRFGDRGRDVVRRQSVLSALRLLHQGVDLIV
ncbi:MAG: CinA family protein [Maricaulis sp.]|jgi:nicotinamide-nucleotide amidase|uniref:CinA family protein n=1 Tax=Maricaulis sp. TaxID=1486257 RepID=UPI001B233AC5|nr:CinA family protein [Maricaulis sp.]MBO6730498.1 CinA family protein [Maricaulis sp.]MBO6846523.1 CinA family protein [Maricaulis sp.]MBO6876754.1 CinA family protein [Maricaulis sp.]MDM7982895.1 CinA family protein [Maricaulis sp.]